MILGHDEIVRRLVELFPCIPPYKIGPASADVRVGLNLIQENGYHVRLDRTTPEKPYWLQPGQFVLIDMYEATSLPVDITAQFILKSTIARAGYNHSLAGLIDPGWDGILTMEVKNNNEVRKLPLYLGMPIGQLVYYETVGATKYAGRYQNSLEVSAARKEV